MKVSPLKSHEQIARIELSPKELDYLEQATDAAIEDMRALPEAQAVAYGEHVGNALVQDDDPRLQMLSAYLRTLANRNAHHAAVISGLLRPEDTLPPTPDHYLAPDEYELLKPQARRLIILGMMGVYGYGYSERQQPGTIHNEVISIKDHFDTDGISANPTQELGLHIEDAYLNTPYIDGAPDWLSILMLRNPDVVPTTISMPRSAELPAWVSAKLRESNYVVRKNSAQDGSEADPEFKVSILYDANGQESYRVNAANLGIEAYDDELRNVLMSFKAHLAEKTVHVPLQPGDLLLIDNKRVLHGRALYRPEQLPRWDGNDRYQSRVIANRDRRLAEFETAPRLVSQTEILEAADAVEKSYQVIA